MEGLFFLITLIFVLLPLLVLGAIYFEVRAIRVLLSGRRNEHTPPG